MRKKKQESGFRRIEGDAGTKMNYILPEILAPYFLLDGEYLEKFWDDLSRVKIGVEQISQLNLLTNTSDASIEVLGGQGVPTRFLIVLFYTSKIFLY